MNENATFTRMARQLWDATRRNQRPNMPVHMAPEERDCYEHLLTLSETVVEYGVGGSTLMALKQRGLKKLISVDSDPRWIDNISQVPEVASAISDGTANILYADIGEVGRWGKPVGKEKIEQWFRYPATPWEHIDRADLVFVDGRFRVACIIEAVLRAQPRTIIAVHDFWDRPQYHATLQFLEWRQSCGTLGVFRARADIDRESAMALLEKARIISA